MGAVYAASTGIPGEPLAFVFIYAPCFNDASSVAMAVREQVCRRT